VREEVCEMNRETKRESGKVREKEIGREEAYERNRERERVRK
jgi:hypothetical protein